MPNKNGAGQLIQSGYINISYITSVLAIICGTICVLGTIKRVKSMPEFKTRNREKNAFFKIFYNFFKTLKNKNFSPLIFGYSVALISAAFLTSVGMHLFTYSFHFTSMQISLLMSILFIGAIFSQPVWIYISKRMDKKPALNVALTILLCGIGLISFIFCFRNFLAINLTFYLILPCVLFCGFGTGALYSLPISMFADVVTLEKIKSQENKTATYSGYMTFSYNVSNSIALLIIGVLLDLIKFNPKEPVQAMKVQNALGVIVILGCSISITLAILIFNKYKLTRTDILKEQLRSKENSKNNLTTN